MIYPPQAKELPEQNEAKRMPLCTMRPGVTSFLNCSLFQCVAFRSYSCLFSKRSFCDGHLLIR